MTLSTDSTSRRIALPSATTPDAAFAYVARTQTPTEEITADPDTYSRVMVGVRQMERGELLTFEDVFGESSD